MPETSLNRSAASTRVDRFVDWFKSRERSLLLLGAAAQVVALVGMIASRSVPYLSGQTVLLQVQPIDPRDMFRGDYVILSYPFSVVPPGGIPGLTVAKPPDKSARREGQTVYVSLITADDGTHYNAGAYSLTAPTRGLYLRGTLIGWNRIEYGIESYYVQEGTGQKYEDAIRNRRLWAEVAVAPDGRAAVKGLRIE